jgi:hypothetical protein
VLFSLNQVWLEQIPNDYREFGVVITTTGDLLWVRIPN